MHYHFDRGNEKVFLRVLCVAQRLRGEWVF